MESGLATATSASIIYMKTLLFAALLAFANTVAFAQLDTWTASTAAPANLSHAGCAGLSGVLYVVGGRNNAGTGNTNAVLAFDTVTGTWGAETALLAPVSDAAVSRSGSKIYIAGGLATPAGVPISVTRSYDPLTKIWTTRTAMTTARFGAVATFDSSTFIVIGGDTGGAVTGIVEGFSTAGDVWSAKTAMPTARRNASATVIGTILYVVGGDTGAGALDTVEAYDLKGDKWSSKAPLPAARTKGGAVTLNNVLYYCGGTDAAGQPSRSTFMYDPTTDQWLSAPDMPTALAFAAVGKVGGDLAVAGGIGASSTTNALSFYKAGSQKFVVMSNGDPTPENPAGALFKAFGNPAINNFGHCAYQATLFPLIGGVTTSTASGIWVDKGGALARLVVRTGDPAPGAPAGAIFAALGDPVLNNTENVAFIGKLKVAGAVTTANAIGIWTNAGTGGLKLVALRGNIAPDCGSAKFSTFLSVLLPDNSSAIFLAKLVVVGSVTAKNDLGIWSQDSAANVHLVAREGQQVVVNGVIKTILTIAAFPPLATIAGQSRGMNVTADIVFRVTFTDATQAVIHATAP